MRRHLGTYNLHALRLGTDYGTFAVYEEHDTVRLIRLRPPLLLLVAAQY